MSRPLSADQFRELARSQRTLQLRTIARFIVSQWPELDADVIPSWSSTDRKVGRLRAIGRGRHGGLLRVWWRNGRTPGTSPGTSYLDVGWLLYHHDTSDSYRRTFEATSDVSRWLDHPDHTTTGHRCPFCRDGMEAR